MNSRKTFADVLASASVDVAAEYRSLQTVFYGRHLKSERGWTMCPRRTLENAFQWMGIRGTAISLDDFDQRYGFNFNSTGAELTVDRLVSFCEYIINLTRSYLQCDRCEYDEWIDLLATQIKRTIERIGYIGVQQGEYVIYVEKQPAATLVVETLPTSVSYRIISYSHHSNKGDLREKRETLSELAMLLEPRRNELKQIDQNLAKRVFSAFNNLNIRHDNVTPESQNYKEAVAELSDGQLECHYDTTYVLCLIAFLKLEYRGNIDELCGLLASL